MYVNPFSENLAELGSKDFPFKELSMPLLLVQNYLEFQDVNITIFIIENSIVYIPPDLAYFVNMGSVTITTYAETQHEPEQSIIKILPDNIPSFSPKSKFILLSDLTPKLGTILANPSLTEKQKEEISLTQVGFHITGTNFEMAKIDIQSTVPDQNFVIFLPTTLNEKSLKFHNSSVRTQGGLLKSSTPGNIDFYGLNIETTNSSFGIHINTDCQLSTTEVNDIFVDRELCINNSQTRSENLTGPFVSITTAASVTVKDFEVEILGTGGEGHPPINFGTSPL